MIPHTTWMKTIQSDLSSLDLELRKPRELAQNLPLRKLMCLYSAMHSSGACYYTVSQENDTGVANYNLDSNQPTVIIFGR